MLVINAFSSNRVMDLSAGPLNRNGHRNCNYCQITTKVKTFERSLFLPQMKASVGEKASSSSLAANETNNAVAYG